MPPPEKIEMETHHNQSITRGAEQRSVTDKGSPQRKVVAIQLNEKEQAALAYVGGIPGLKKLLCPEGRCIKCRKNPVDPDNGGVHLCPQCHATEIDKS